MTFSWNKALELILEHPKAAITLIMFLLSFAGISGWGNILQNNTIEIKRQKLADKGQAEQQYLKTIDAYYQHTKKDPPKPVNKTIVIHKDHTHSDITDRLNKLESKVKGWHE